MRLPVLLFIAFTLIAAAPIAILASWASSTAVQNEMNPVQDRNLLIARSLTSTLSQYIRDVKAVFGLTIDSGTIDHPVAGLTGLLASLNMIHVSIIAPNGTVQATLPGLAEHAGPNPSPSLLADLRTLASDTPNRIGLSTLYHNTTGQPVFYLVRQFPDGRLALGALSTSYLVSLQQAIRSGDDRYAVIVDTKGHVIAHPVEDWIAASRDISGIPVVTAMMRGETGVGAFHSPAFDTDMIAGYTVVPETGWGVMVLQPLAELRHRADQINQAAIVIAIPAVACAALMAWLIALSLTRPVRRVADTAAMVLQGDDQAAVPPFQALVPSEIRDLGTGFNAMLQALRKRMSEIRQALHDQELANAAKAQFLANMSHEIRTPLNGVVGMIELMQMTDLTPPQRRHIETAAQSSQALLRLVDDILDLSRIESGRLQLAVKPFHLPSMIDDVRLMFAEQARAKALTLLTSIADSLNIVVAGDRHRLQQVLANLVGNAIKFTSQGTVSVRCIDQQPVGTGIRIRFEVSDTGIGVPVSKQEAIFDTFTQADSSTTRRYAGTGLGLSIARQLVQIMNGEIGTDSTVDVGSTFWFSVVLERRADVVLPAAPAASTRPAEPPQPVLSAAVKPAFISPAGREFRATLEGLGRDSVAILLVEDNAANLRVTQALLETLGCRVTAAINGLQAISLYRENTFDLVLMDCQMPEMDGYEATRAIRQLEAIQKRHTPIIALTAHAMESSREAALASGMDDQITKPLTMAILTRKLLQWLVPVEPSPS